MDYVWIGIGIAVLLLLNKLILAPVRRLTLNVLSGLAVLYLMNSYGYILGLHTVPITLATGLIIGILGLPGVLIVTVYYTFF